MLIRTNDRIILITSQVGMKKERIKEKERETKQNRYTYESKKDVYFRTIEA